MTAQLVTHGRRVDVIVPSNSHHPQDLKVDRSSQTVEGKGCAVPSGSRGPGRRARRPLATEVTLLTQDLCGQMTWAEWNRTEPGSRDDLRKPNADRRLKTLDSDSGGEVLAVRHVMEPPRSAAQ